MNLLNNVTTIDEAIMRLLSHPYALNYNEEKMMESYNKSKVSEKEVLASHLCGMSGESIVIAFMDGDKDAIEPFLKNVSFNTEKSIPLILRVINLRLI